MVKNDLIVKFSNDTPGKLFICIDPPVEEFCLETGETLLLRIVGYKLHKEDVSNILDIRYTSEKFINVDVNYFMKLIVCIKNEERVIWGE